ncbi:hypothetical protein PGB90_001866 [Kerria lacca]
MHFERVLIEGGVKLEFSESSSLDSQQIETSNSKDHKHGVGARSNAERRFRSPYTITSSFREAAPPPRGTNRATDPVLAFGSD